MDNSNGGFSQFFESDIFRNFRDDLNHESDFVTPSSQTTWIIIYFFLAVVCISLSPLLAIAFQNAPIKNPIIELIFNGGAVSMMGVGIFSSVQCIQALYKRIVIGRLRNQNPSKPWKWRADWAQGNIQNKKGSSAVWIIALLYNIIFVPLMIAAMMSKDIGTSILSMFIPSGFLFVGIGLMGYSFLFTLRRRKYGTSVCRPSIMPVKPGVEVQYSVKIPARLTGVRSIECELLSYGAVKVPPDDDISTDIEDLPNADQPPNDEEQSAPAQKFGNIKKVPLDSVRFADNRTEFSVPFALLPDAQPTIMADEESKGTVWFLEINADNDGLNYKALFEVPVFSNQIDVEQVFIKDAINKGTRILWSIAFIGFTAMIVFILVLELLDPAFMTSFGALGFFIALLTMWLTRSIMIPRWKLWAYTNVDDVAELKKKALEQKILYPEEYFLTKTEFQTSADKQKLAQLESKSLNDKNKAAKSIGI